MSKQLLIWMLICLNGAEYAHAQWTKKDSVWLHNVQSGKERLQLNSETMKAIESGSLINFDKPVSKMQMAPVSPLPILKDFSEYLGEFTTKTKVPLKDLHPSVFMKYGPKYTKELRSYILIRDAIHKESPFYPRWTAIDVGKMTSRKEYVHARNAERDGTWKNYNNLPTPDIIRKKRKYERDQAKKIAIQDTVLKADTIQRIDTIRAVGPVQYN